MILYSTFESPIGDLVLAVNARSLCALSFVENWPEQRQLFERAAPETSVAPGPLPKEIEGCMQAYFGGELSALDAIAIDLTGTPFQNRVWGALRKVPAGQTISYSQLARKAGFPGAARAVGTANAVNPIALVVPCHRVIRADGSIGEYGGSVERKQWLLHHEGACVNGDTGKPMNKSKQSAKRVGRFVKLASSRLGE